MQAPYLLTSVNSQMFTDVQEPLSRPQERATTTNVEPLNTNMFRPSSVEEVDDPLLQVRIHSPRPTFMPDQQSDRVKLGQLQAETKLIQQELKHLTRLNTATLRQHAQIIRDASSLESEPHFVDTDLPLYTQQEFENLRQENDKLAEENAGLFRENATLKLELSKMRKKVPHEGERPGAARLESPRYFPGTFSVPNTCPMP